MPTGKSATVEICYRTDEHWFKCPECGSLNINGPETLDKCPDCNAEFSIPQIELCDC